MKLKNLLFVLPFFAVPVSLSAKPLIDSVGVKNNDGKKMILFKVKAKDTYYSIGHRYNIKPEVLMKFNGKKKAILSIGTVVEVPTDMPYKKSAKGKESTEKIVKETKKEKKARLAREAAEAKAEKKHKHKDLATQTTEQATEQTQPERVAEQPVQQPVQQPLQQDNTPATQYKVSAGETLYAISKRFNTTVDNITKLNNLTSTTLTPGQVLLVKAAAAPVQPVANPVTETVKTHDSIAIAPVKDSSNSERHLNANRFGIYEKNEKGVASWMEDASLDPNKKLVLHRSAPIGTVIKITNPMTNRTTFAKVVGRFTDSEDTKDVIIIMTKNVADSLGALDKRFHVNISYGSPNE
ncbi:MAG: LysM peptidoglycan-binding domain-containing protein [Sphingobacteriales bacterium]